MAPVSKTVGVFNNVQLLRGLAAMLVVLCHANLEAVEHNVWDKEYFYFGSCGVDVFFAISGFIMVVTTHSTSGNGQRWQEFLRKRLTRIVPMYWFFTSLKLMLVVLVPSIALHSPAETWYVISSYLFIPSFNRLSDEVQPLLSVGWTLSYEMFFYAVFAASIALARRPLRIIVPVLMSSSLIGMWRNGSWPASATIFDPILLEFLLGAFVGLATLRGFRLPPRLALPLALLMFAALPLFGPMIFSHGEGGTTLWRVAFWGVPGAVLLMAVTSLEGTRWAAGAGSLAVLLGNASYAIYLSHGFITPVFGRLFRELHLIGPLAAVVLMVLACITSAIVGIMTYRYVEKPMLGLFRSKQWVVKRARVEVAS
jgi:exopolysaccharide production protein ExoZ